MFNVRINRAVFWRSCFCAPKFCLPGVSSQSWDRVFGIEGGVGWGGGRSAFPITKKEDFAQ